MKYRDSDRIQTCNLLIRSQMLYSVELRSHHICFYLASAKVLLFPIPAKLFEDFFMSFSAFSPKLLILGKLEFFIDKAQITQINADLLFIRIICVIHA